MDPHDDENIDIDYVDEWGHELSEEEVEDYLHEEYFEWSVGSY